MTQLPAEPYYKVRRRQLIARGIFGLIGTLAVLAGVYGIDRLRSNPADAACQPAVNEAARLAPLVHGEVAALTMAQKPFSVPDVAFKDAEGHDRKLDDWRGRTVLLNLWATWCVPCRAEMPALDRLQAKFGGPDFQVVAVNIDTNRLDRPKTFFADAGVKTLSLYADPSADVFEALKVAGKALGLPTSLLIDKDGCEIGVMAGPAPWDSEDGAKLIATMLNRQS